jgi:hypothetical protein
LSQLGQQVERSGSISATVSLSALSYATNLDPC